MRTRFVYWLLWWLYKLLLLGAMGGIITYLAIRSGYLALGIGAAGATAVFLAVALVGRSKELRYAPGVFWKWPDQKALSVQAGGVARQLDYADPETLPALEQAAQRTPSDPSAWVSYGKALIRATRYDDALTALERALALDPRLADAWASKSVALLNLGRIDQALAACESTLALTPESVRAWAVKAVTLARLGRNAELLGACDHALAEGADHLPAWYASEVTRIKGQTLFRLERYAEALDISNRLLDAQPNMAWAWTLKGASLLALGRPREAKIAVRRARELCE